MKILVSACLLGEKVRYDGRDNFLDHPIIRSLYEQRKIVSICPEVAGGLSIPRLPAERQVSGKVLTKENKDVTAAYFEGAQKALALAKKYNITIAILKARSPSCGNEWIYDGSFSKTLISGMGVTAELLSQNGIHVFNEEQIDLALEVYSSHF